jgi:hypothetical protein
VSKKNQAKCAVTRGEVDLEKYAKVDGFWRELGLAAPARRALVNNKLFKLSDLKKFTMHEVAEFHGIGANALTILKNAKAPFKK